MRKYIILMITTFFLISCSNFKNEENKTKSVSFKNEKELKKEFIDYLNDSDEHLKSKSKIEKTFFNPILTKDEINKLKNYDIIKSYNIKKDSSIIKDNNFEVKKYLIEKTDNILLVPSGEKDFCIALTYIKDLKKWKYIKLEIKDNCINEYDIIQKVKEISKNNKIFKLKTYCFSYYAFWDESVLKIYNPFTNKFLSDKDIFEKIKKYYHNKKAFGEDLID